MKVMSIYIGLILATLSLSCGKPSAKQPANQKITDDFVPQSETSFQLGENSLAGKVFTGSVVFWNDSVTADALKNMLQYSIEGAELQNKASKALIESLSLQDVVKLAEYDAFISKKEKRVRELSYAEDLVAGIRELVGLQKELEQAEEEITLHAEKVRTQLYELDSQLDCKDDPSRLYCQIKSLKAKTYGVALQYADAYMGVMLKFSQLESGKLGLEFLRLPNEVPQGVNASLANVEFDCSVEHFVDIDGGLSQCRTRFDALKFAKRGKAHEGLLLDAKRSLLPKQGWFNENAKLVEADGGILDVAASMSFFLPEGAHLASGRGDSILGTLDGQKWKSSLGVTELSSILLVAKKAETHLVNLQRNKILLEEHREYVKSRI